MKKILCLLLSALFLLTLLVGCKPPAEQPTGDSSSAEEDPPKDQPDDQAGAQILTEELSKYSIVYSETAETELVKLANDLSRRIREMFGVMMQVRDDYFNEFSTSYKVSDYEILIGATNREESRAYIDKLLYKDGGYTLTGKKLVLAGADDYVTQQVISEFMLNVLFQMSPDSPVFFSASDAKLLSGKYKHPSLKLNGTDIASYGIVYPQTDGAFARGLALRLQLAIAETCGQMLPVTDDSTPAGGYEICIGKTSRASSYSAELKDGAGYVQTVGNKVLLYGNNALGNSAAVDSLISAMEEDSSQALDVILSEGVITSVNDTGSIRTMSFNLQMWDVTDVRKRRIRDTILTYLPDTIGFQEGSAEWHAYLKQELSEYYEMVGDVYSEVPNVAIEYVPIMYARDKFELVTAKSFWLTNTPDQLSILPGCEYYRSVTYVILKNRSDGDEWMHINMHWDTAPDEVGIRDQEAALILEFLSDYPDLACVLTGDLNCNYNSNAFQTLTYDKLTNSSDICRNMSIGTASLPGAIDYAVVYDYYIDVLHYQIVYQRIHGGYASDHRAVFIDFVIDYDGTEVLDKSQNTGNKLNTQPDIEGKEYGKPHLF